MDIRGTIRAALKLFKEDVHKHLLLEDLGFAARIYYNLRDFESDMSAGYINISQEEIERYTICDFDTTSLGVRRWFADQASAGLAHLERHRNNIAQVNYRFLTSLTLSFAYEQPARRYFQHVLADVCA